MFRLTIIRRFFLRLLSVLRSGQAEHDLAREIGAHLQLLEDDFVAKGMNRDAARLAARRAFGGVEQAKEHQRDARAFRWLDDSRTDAKLGARMLAKYPGLSVIGGVGLTVAIAIGAAFFSFFSSYIHAVLPVEDGDRVVALENWNTEVNNEARRSMHDFVTWRREMTTVTEISAFRPIRLNAIIPGGPAEEVAVAQMTASAFQLTRVAPVLGRPLIESDEAAGAPPVVVIGFEAWQSRFAGDRAVIGRVIRLGNSLCTIVGVMPQGFRFPVNHNYWTPLRIDTTAVARGEGPELFVFGRLRDGATLTQAQAELSAIGTRAASDFPAVNRRLQPRVMPYTYPILDIQGISSWFFASVQGVVSILVLIVAVNVAVLIYARTATRQGEIAVRTALGASRSRIVGQLFIEALVLASAAAAVALVLARFGLSQAHAIMAQEADGLPYFIDARLTNGAIVYTVGVAILAAAIAGIIPALNATGRRINFTMKQSAGGSGLRLGHTWTLMIVAQVALAVAGLPMAIATGWVGVESVSTTPAFDERAYLAAFISADPDMRDGTQRLATLKTELIATLEEEPSVAGVSVAWTTPNSGRSARIEVDGAAPQAGATAVHYNRVAPDLFEMLGARIETGRALTASDGAPSTAPAIIVNHTFVDRVLGGGNAIGRRVRYIARGDQPPDAVDTTTQYEIVGVVSDLYVNDTNPKQVDPFIFHALRGNEGSLAMIVRVRDRDPLSIAPRLRALAADLDPTVRISMSSFTEFERQEVLVYRLIVMVLTLLIVAVLLLSAAGVYAMMSFIVSQRRKEIGIRSAMGADAGQLLRHIFAKAAMQIASGIAVGVGAAALLNWADGGQLLGAIGTPLLSVMSLVMIIVGLVATIGPARRSLKIDPTEALRSE